MYEFLKEKKELVKVGKIIFESGLTDTHGGNISMRIDDYILIKKSGKMLGYLEPIDIVVTTVDENPMLDKNASIELKVHRAIYQAFPEVKGIVHAHSPYTVACSLVYDEIVPVDSEGKLLLGKIPVLSAKQVVSSDEVAQELPKLLKSSPVAVVKSHGPFAVGKTLEEALKYLSALENSCKIISILKAMEM
ncbi:class II aldolase/adducin family protein [Desulfurobacterium thermolithotrophum DSM 11699]|uniref:Class II aldolase/adducin family protein n=1 Tax=Desulfurobacterium thermolithotrophum (strain DSM 11699 / BSA) TaxID=868864 RepID=F0S374_DESTD|nr:class II aldolase/adducin family protein [Desulfurobacterium thermolithotrophum]ADY73296.1 class II aldolase/adducin family protein [Desulfurobacterium thermolithotrophum DSM 11699]